MLTYLSWEDLLEFHNFFEIKKLHNIIIITSHNILLYVQIVLAPKISFSENQYILFLIRKFASISRRDGDGS